MNLNKIYRFLAITLATSFLVLGCAGAQKAMDKKVLSGSIDKDYDKDIASKSGQHTYGQQVLEADLPSGEKLYLHVEGYESSKSTTLGIWGKSKYSYKVFAFKVTDNQVSDWAYALHQPDDKYSHVFGFTMGYKADPIIEDIKKNYRTMVETSEKGSVNDW